MRTQRRKEGTWGGAGVDGRFLTQVPGLARGEHDTLVGNQASAEVPPGRTEELAGGQRRDGPSRVRPLIRRGGRRRGAPGRFRRVRACLRLRSGDRGSCGPARRPLLGGAWSPLPAAARFSFSGKSVPSSKRNTPFLLFGTGHLRERPRERDPHGRGAPSAAEQADGLVSTEICAAAAPGDPPDQGRVPAWLGRGCPGPPHGSRAGPRGHPVAGSRPRAVSLLGPRLPAAVTPHGAPAALPKRAPRISARVRAPGPRCGAARSRTPPLTCSPSARRNRRRPPRGRAALPVTL